MPGQSLQKRNNSDDAFYVTFNRLLAKNEKQKKLYHERTKDYTPYDIGNKKVKSNTHTISIYSHSNSRKFDDLDNYKKNYKSRYSKKKGLAKLDCYYEKKIFDKIECVNILADKTQNGKKRFIKKILNKYTISLFLLAIIPHFAFIIPALYGDKDPKNNFMQVCFGDCKSKDPGNNSACRDGFNHVSVELGNAMFYINDMVFLISIIAFISIITYTAVKYIKYEFLKHGLGNITLKEYFRLLKNTF